MDRALYGLKVKVKVKVFKSFTDGSSTNNICHIPHKRLLQKPLVYYHFLNITSRFRYFIIQKKILKSISGQCIHFIPHENTQKPLILWCFQCV